MKAHYEDTLLVNLMRVYLLLLLVLAVLSFATPPAMRVVKWLLLVAIVGGVVLILAYPFVYPLYENSLGRPVPPKPGEYFPGY